MISIRFIAGCGPSQVLPHTEGVMKKCQKNIGKPQVCGICRDPFGIWGK